MANLAIIPKDTNIIQQFIQDAMMVTDGTMATITGDNSSARHKIILVDFIWTDDIVNPIFGQNAEGDEIIIGYDKTADQLTPTTNGIIEVNTDKSFNEQKTAMEWLSWLSGKSYQDVEDYINTNVTDLASARTYLIRLSKILLALIKTQL